MSGIWDQVVTGLTSDLDAETWRLWNSPEFQAMGSEIERAFAASFVMGLRIGDGGPMIGYPEPGGPGGFFLSPQHNIGKYRVDFLLGRVSEPTLPRCVVIECDGHDWHEKTKEQAAKDKSRDRFLSQKVGRVIHFTGSEIYRSPAGCVTEAGEVLAALHGVELP
jgi:very-short-patch-repair endonuclease